MIKVLNIIGARPQIIKAAAISRAIKSKFNGAIDEVVVHTGQHYDEAMSEVFIKELGVSEPQYNLHVGSGKHGEQTAKMINQLEDLFLKEEPDWVLVYGDTNSTLAAAISASKMHIPIIHVEAGLRSFNKKMPEEINRIMCDHVSTLLFSPTETGVVNLKNEGLFSTSKDAFSFDNPGVFHCGDVMYDNTLHFGQLVGTSKSLNEKYQNLGVDFILSTIHRPSNTDDYANLKHIVDSLITIATSENKNIVIPLHPRTRKHLDKFKLLNLLQESTLIKLIPPASFLAMIWLEKQASFVITDSGGVQKEAYFFKKKCLILRSETEWVEILENKAALLSDPSGKNVVNDFELLKDMEATFTNVFGDGKAAEFICEKIIACS